MKKYLILKNYAYSQPDVIASSDDQDAANEYATASAKIDKEHSYSVAIVEFTTGAK